MKSNICKIKKDGEGLENILAEVEKVSVYNGLGDKEALRLRLLAEEMTGMLSELVKNFEGQFWAENEDNRYELHVSLTAEKMSPEVKKELVSVSKSGKNAASTGIMAKIRAAAEEMFAYSDSAGAVMPMGCFDAGALNMDYAYTYVWTLEQYRQEVQSDNKKEEWDELEKSIVANLADDVIVGVKGKHVDIIIKKTF